MPGLGAAAADTAGWRPCPVSILDLGDASGLAVATPWTGLCTTTPYWGLHPPDHITAPKRALHLSMTFEQMLCLPEQLDKTPSVAALLQDKLEF